MAESNRPIFIFSKTEYASSRGESRWADKTPGYALSLDYSVELFPNCQIVQVIRDGRDAVASHRHCRRYVLALKAIEKWPHYIRPPAGSATASRPAATMSPLRESGERH
jgi:hypothetical protein